MTDPRTHGAISPHERVATVTLQSTVRGCAGMGDPHPAGNSCGWKAAKNVQLRRPGWKRAPKPAGKL